MKPPFSYYILFLQPTILLVLSLYSVTLSAQADTTQIIIQLKAGKSISQIVDLSQRSKKNSWHLSTLEPLNKQINVHLLTLAKGSNAALAIGDLMNNDMVLYAHPNYTLKARSKIPDDPLFMQQWNLSKIEIEEIWNKTTGGLTYLGDTIVIGVMESGIDLDHEDLRSILWQNPGEIPDNNVDDDQNGYVDDYAGVSLDHGKDKHSKDAEGHGSSVLGVMAANGNNSKGISGTNWHVKIALFTTEDLSMANAIKAYTYFAEMRRKYNQSDGREGAFIVATNSSFGYENLFEEDAPIFCEMYDLMGAEGILSVGAAENDQGNADVFGDLPANCSSESLIITTSTDSDDRLAVAGFGKKTIDLSAPGESILSTSNDDQYVMLSGTSFASPLVCGVIALLYSHPSDPFAEFIYSNPVETSQLIKNLILNNVTKVPDLLNNTSSQGRLNARKAYEGLLNLYPVEVTSTIINSFPNPVLEDATFIFGNTVNHFILEIFDTSGKRHLEKNVTNQTMSQYTIPLSSLPPGIYFMRMISGKNRYQSRFIKF